MQDQPSVVVAAAAAAAAVAAVVARVDVDIPAVKGPPHRQQRFVEQAVARLLTGGRFADGDAALPRWRRDWLPLEYCS